jgi:VanZ family protein
LFKFIEKYKVKVIYIPFVIYWMILFTLTTLPGKDLPDVGINDKISHFTAYCGLAVFLNIFLMVQNKKKILKEKAWMFALIFGASYAMIDELHQLFIPGRSCDVLDWTADVIGLLLGLLVVKILMILNNYKPYFAEK